MRLRVCGSLAVLSLLVLDVAVDSRAQARKADTISRRAAERLEAEYRGGLVTPPLPKPNFTLTDTTGAKFDFRSRTDGYVTLLFFGYTHCPDICPMHMSFLGSAFKRLPKDVADQFRIVFVTTDPDRDTPRLLRSWLNQFGTQMVGLTGEKTEVQAAQRAANVPVAKGAPTYDHSAFVLAYSRDNRAHVIYPAGVSQADWLHDLPLLAKDSWGNR